MGSKPHQEIRFGLWARPAALFQGNTKRVKPLPTSPLSSRPERDTLMQTRGAILPHAGVDDGTGEFTPARWPAMAGRFIVARRCVPQPACHPCYGDMRGLGRRSASSSKQARLSRLAGLPLRSSNSGGLPNSFSEYVGIRQVQAGGDRDAGPPLWQTAKPKPLTLTRQHATTRDVIFASPPLCSLYP